MLERIIIVYVTDMSNLNLFCLVCWCSSSCTMFKNTFQSGFLSILYSLGYASFALFDNLNIIVSTLVADIPGCSLIDLFNDFIGANLCKYGIKKVCNFCSGFAGTVTCLFCTFAFLQQVVMQNFFE